MLDIAAARNTINFFMILMILWFYFIFSKSLVTGLTEDKGTGRI